MNKTIKYLLLLSVVIMAFAVGFRVGGAKGYDAGYKEGYRYDCKAEIAALYEQVKSQKKVTDFAQQSIKKVLRENDSLKNPAYAQQRYKDSVAWYEQFSRDSIKHYRIARHKNDSLASITGKRVNYYTDNGKFNFMSCLMLDDLDKVNECKSHKSLIKAFRESK